MFSALFLLLLPFFFAMAKAPEQKMVRVNLTRTVGQDGRSYHPNSKGTLIPESLAKALGKEPMLPGGQKTDKGDDKPTSDLPEDLPGRDILIGSGLDTGDKVLSHEDLTQIKGIGKGTKEKILSQLSGEPEEKGEG